MTFAKIFFCESVTSISLLLEIGLKQWKKNVNLTTGGRRNPAALDLVLSAYTGW